MSFDRIIEVYERTSTRNEYNEQVDTLSHFASLYASVNYHGGREGFYARQVVASKDVAFKVRYYPGLTSTMVVKFEGAIHQIEYIEPRGRQNELVIHTKFADNYPGIPDPDESNDDSDDTDDNDSDT